MNEKIKAAVEKYQCPGCVGGCDISCYDNDPDGKNVECHKHCAGTFGFPAEGRFLLGMPKGFNRLGKNNFKYPIQIFEKFADSDWDYSKYNIPVWKHLNEEGHTLARGLSPRTNRPFIHVFLEDCRDKLNCLEITQEDIDFMD